MSTRVWIDHVGSVRTALLLLALLAAVVLLEPGRGWLGSAIALCSVSLAVAIATHPALRRRLPLLLAHLALLALVALVALGRWCQLEGRFELTEGVAFDGQLLDTPPDESHRRRLAALGLVHQGFSIDYAAGRQRGPTRNLVRWAGGNGASQAALIGDHRPLVVDGYRIYTSPNKGFAPLLRWEPTQGAVQRGAVHLPSFPMHELRQSNEWRLPDGRSVWVMLRIEETLIDPAAETRFSLPKAPLLVVRLGDERVELRSGQGVDLAGGRLVFEGLRTWMGYRLSHDPTLPWLLAASLLAVAGLAWHYLSDGRPEADRQRQRSDARVVHG